ncbi:hypothetical protein Ancab_033372 [Ancistrocladus abbreviatus]
MITAQRLTTTALAIPSPDCLQNVPYMTSSTATLLAPALQIQKTALLPPPLPRLVSLETDH